jgi:hypothetical protein
MNTMAQNTIEELGRIVPKDRLTHYQSWEWRSGTLVNSRVQKRATPSNQIWLLQPPNNKLGSHDEAEIPRAENFGDKNWRTFRNEGYRLAF